MSRQPEHPEHSTPDRSEAPRSTVDDHDETGLDLARATARSLAGAARVVQTGIGRTRAKARRRARAMDPQASGAHPDDRDPQTLDVTLGRLVAEQGWVDDIRMHGVFGRWPTIVGPEVAQHTTPVSFHPPEDGAGGGAGGRLVVRTDSTAWATQMRLLAPTVVRRLNEELGDGTVAVIDVQGPTVPSWKRGRRSIRGARGPRDTYG
jgi:predicted nucleic acid-binding Zn ribbon protein